MTKYLSIALLLVTGVAVFPSSRAEEGPLEFNRDIRLILSENCFSCHGFDVKHREAGLRLDLRDEATKTLESGSTAVKPGDVAASALVARIESTDPAVMMPPPETKKSLTPAQIATLKKWIAEGAPYEGHWSFEPVKSVEPPAVNDATKVRNEIDRFILSELARHGLSPSPEADKTTLIRRLTLDLTGLPPTPAEVEAFVKDNDPQAYERLVDRLLDSPRYAERMTVFWLDLVRYADSVGYHGDQEMTVFPYRDYVIKSFQANKPFNQFTIEQLAGDLLPEVDDETKIASGYNRLGMMSAEGGIQDKEYRAKYAAERIRNLSGTWLGLTMGCCECHDHKFDPLATRDFYRMQAFFADLNELGFYPEGYPSGKWGPRMKVPTANQKTKLAEFTKEVADAEADFQRDRPELAEAQQSWELNIAPEINWTVLKPSGTNSSGGATLTLKDDQSILASGTAPAKDTYVVTAPGVGATITAVRVEALPDESLPVKGPGRAGNGNFVLTEIECSIVMPGGETKPVAFANSSASAEQASGGEAHPDKRWSAASAIDGDKRGENWGWAILPEAGLANHAVFQTSDPIEIPTDATIQVTLKHNFDGAHALGRFRLSVSTDNRPANAIGSGLPRNIRDALAIPKAQRNGDQLKLLSDHYKSFSPQLAKERERLEVAKRRRDDLDKAIPTTLVTEHVEPRMIRVLPRGNWMDDSGEVVEPGVPASLPALGETNGRPTRLDLAKWLTRGDNPLTSRVFVNRMWKNLFGAGLSRKLDDFGSQGDSPSHPKLLDWLSRRFVESNWNVKALIKSIVMSATYRQSSATPGDALERDTANRWLARQGRWRLDAEFVRDNTLAISGLLVHQSGGASVRPYQPAGYWSFLNFPTREWQNDSGESLYRRGLYTHWQRQYLHPSLLAFDAPTREECTADRVRSNTPLQSLVLLNDPIYVESARAFAERVLKEAPADPSARVDAMFRLALGRAAKESEKQLLTQLVAKHQAEFAADPQAAKSLLAIGEHRSDSGIAPEELAAWASAARTILNLHATVTRN
jgi:hypothetical protein